MEHGSTQQPGRYLRVARALALLAGAAAPASCAAEAHPPPQEHVVVVQSSGGAVVDQPDPVVVVERRGEENGVRTPDRVVIVDAGEHVQQQQQQQQQPPPPPRCDAALLANGAPCAHPGQLCSAHDGRCRTVAQCVQGTAGQPPQWRVDRACHMRGPLPPPELPA